MAKQEDKTPQEASNIFHSIMKASVTPAKKEETHLDKFISAVKDKYGIDIILNDGVVYPKGTNADTVAKVQNFYKEWNG